MYKVSFAQEKITRKIVSEKLIAQMDWLTMKIKTFAVSPDSKRVAYGGKIGYKWLVVVDGNEGKKYDGIDIGIRRITFDSSNSLYYLVYRVASISLVNEEIQKPQ